MAGGHGHGHGSGRTGDLDPPGEHGGGPARRGGVRVLLVSLVVLVAGASVLGMVLLWPTGEPPEQVPVAGGLAGLTVVTAEVLEARSTTCAGISEDRLPDGTIPAQTQCASATARLTSGPDAGTELEVDVPAQVYRSGLQAGDGVDLARYPPQAGVGEIYAWVDFSRDVPLTVLGVAFAVLVVAVGRLRGLAALVGLAVSYATILGFMLPALLRGENAVAVALTGSVAIMVVILYLAHGFSMKTTTALLGTVAGLGLTALLGWAAASAAHLTGLSSEDDFTLSTLTGGTDLSGIVLCGIIVAGLGVLNDVTITQASAVDELARQVPGTSRRDLFSSGMRIGRDHLASTVYTIAFAYAGAALPTLLLIDLYDQPLAQVLTSSAIAEEIVRTVVGAIGLVAAIPLTTAVAAASVAATASAARPGRLERQPS
jgi:uncharacterized membrane protein